MLFYSGQLITLGTSKSCQLKLWDPRISARYSSVIKSYTNRKTNQSNHALYNNVLIHNSLPVIYCGTTDGDVIEWDLRHVQNPMTLNRIVKLHDGAINSMVNHPRKENAIFIASNDTVSEVDLTNSTADTVIIEPISATVTSLDTYSGRLCACSSIGSLYQVSL